jgi:hypothetical protein
MERLLHDAIQTVHPGASCKLIYASKIASWASQHPVMRFHLGQHPIDGLWSLAHWLRYQKDHQIPFQPDQARGDIIREIQQRFAAEDGPIHLRIQGSAGIGKTRLALQVFEDGQDTVFYAPEPPSTDSFFQWLAAKKDAHAILIVDECDADSARKLEQLAQMSVRRLRLLTVGPAEVSGNSPYVYLLPDLAEDALTNIVCQGVPALPTEQARWVARKVGGYVKLATIIAEHIREGKTTVADLLAAYDVQEFFVRQLLPADRNRLAMKGLSLLRRVGWDGELAAEGEAIANFIGMPWNEMQEIIGQMMKGGLVTKQGRYRYVTPELLALWLAEDVWQTRKDALLDLLDQLPSPTARDAMLERLAGLAGREEARTVIEQLLGPYGPFDQIDTLDNERAARVFTILAKGHNQAALMALERLLGMATHDQLCRFSYGRHYIIPILQRLTQWKETFHRAARLLFRLSEAENQTWSNNATGVWTNLFLTYLGETEVPAIERFPLLEEAYQIRTTKTRELVVAVLEQILSIAETGNVIDEPHDGYVPPQWWYPQTQEEDHTYRRAALRLLDQAIHDPDESLRHKARTVFLNSVRDLSRLGLAGEVIARLEAFEIQNDSEQREAWRAVQTLLRYERAALTEEQSRQFEQISERLLGSSFHDRLRRYVGRLSIVDSLEQDIPEEQRPQIVAANLADEAIKAPEALRAELPWLTSCEAENVWFFGRRLGELDAAHTWWDEVVAATRAGNDTLLLCAYLQGRTDAGESEWREQILDTWRDNQDAALLIFDATWRGPATADSLERLITLVDRGWLQPAYLSRLVYGGWVRPLPADALATLIDRLARDRSPEATESQLALLTQWGEAHVNDLPPVLIPAAWKCIEQPSPGQGVMLPHYWAKIGRMLLQYDLPRLLSAILSRVVAGEMRVADDRLPLITEAIVQNPLLVWKVLSHQLLKHSTLAREMQWWAWEQQLLEQFDPTLLLEWASRQPRKRPPLLAQLAKPGQSITPLIRGLLREYGPDSVPAHILAANFVSGAFMGSFTQHEKEHLQTVQGWLQDIEPHVQAWAQQMMRSIKASLPHIQNFEEEQLPF